MTVLAILVGLLIGLSLGALGGGGSILTVPALVYLLGQDPRTATTSSLLIVGATSLIALAPHARAGRVRLAQGLSFGALGAAGAVAGSTASAHVPPEVLLSAFAVLLLVVGVLMLRRSRRGSVHGTDLTTPVVRLRPWRCDCPRAVKVALTATGVGLLTGFFGVGGGFVVVPALVLVLGFSMPAAVGTSLVVIAVNSAVALATRVGVVGTQLDWTVIGLFTAAAVAGSLVGGRLVGRLSPRVLTRGFALLLLVVAAYTAVRSVPTLF